MTDREPHRQDDLLDPADADLDRLAHERRERRFWHREGRDAVELARAAEHRDREQVGLVTRRMIEEGKAELLGRESFAPIFFMTVFVVIFTPLMDQNKVGRLVVLLMVVGTLLLTLQRSLVHRRNLIRIAVLMLTGVAFSIIATLALDHGNDPWRLEAVTSAIFVVVIVVALPALLVRTVLHPRVTLNTLAGVMTAYLFIGLMFTGVFRFIDAVDEGSFFAQTTEPETGDFEYFSFITITTTGYGDLTPGSQPARTAAMAEAIAGQIFLVTVVARVVAMFGQERMVTLAVDKNRTSSGAGPDPDRDVDAPGDQQHDTPPAT